MAADISMGLRFRHCRSLVRLAFPANAWKALSLDQGMSFNSMIYWLDRAFKGDKRPLRVIIAWLSVIALLLVFLLMR
ncbi:hypothetical protein [Pseudomonas sp. HMWF032]|uniref:hypothetical protein n=1 Tax=Pseudomonas sp. HMWF032 TaxID=2056866 RepID=UPI0011B2528C|nr:hypothetical protein [Pseudomonas sp. HMWF032]